RLVAEGGRLIIADFAPHDVEFLREQHQHRRLGFTDGEIGRWLEAAGLSRVKVLALPPAEGQRLTVKIWSAERARQPQRRAA
ncbi:MAG TPA: ArsR family transcriptional regulator, partial [Phenylobacterium sp.]|nr:ArsR family transcriptional regulator [Phenylobacterium sp.]